jgi:outer membrane immunogenic protein
MRLSVAFIALILAAPAIAADYPASPGAPFPGPAPVLRGALPGVQPASDWSGFYFGGNVGYANSTNAISNSVVQPMLQSLVAGTTIAQSIQQQPLVYTGKNQSNAMTFGGFLGYNYQSDDTVLGFELDYARGKFDGYQDGQRSGRTSTYPVAGGEQFESWTAQTNTRFAIRDSGTIRGRVGYAMGSFLPYVTAGIAWARGSFDNSAQISGTFTYTNTTTGFSTTGPLIFTPNTIREQAKDKFFFGYALGAGVDVALSQNIFLRAEAIHSRFSDIGGAEVSINQVRAAAAVKY